MMAADLLFRRFAIFVLTKRAFESRPTILLSSGVVVFLLSAIAAKGARMSAVVLYMSMSLDGFVAGPNESVQNGLGDGGERLHRWIFSGSPVPDELKSTTPLLEGANQQVVEEMMSTGAVISGRGTFEAADGWGGDHHDGVPIIVLRRSMPEAEWTRFERVTYVEDVVSAVESAKRAAGEKNVMMHGVTAARLALNAGLLDELEIHLVPVLLAAGTRLFDGLTPDQTELERVRTLEGDEGLVHLHYRVLRRGTRIQVGE